MKTEIVKSLTKTFEDQSHTTESGIEFWFARDLQNLLGYNEWRNFLNVIAKAKTACENSQNSISYHFVDVNKMVGIGSKAERNILIEQGIKPEELPPEEDIKKLERRVNRESKKLGNSSNKLK